MLFITVKLAYCPPERDPIFVMAERWERMNREAMNRKMQRRNAFILYLDEISEEVPNLPSVRRRLSALQNELAGSLLDNHER